VNQRPRSPSPPPRTRWLAPLAAVVTLALALAWWQPWRTLNAPSQPAPPQATLTPPPPAITRAPERIALPTERPRPGTSPTPPSAAPSATPAATAVAAPTSGGTLLYIGTVDGQSGIVAANADGSAPRLLVPGPYDQLALSPDGARFAVAGSILYGGGAQQVAIFAADGRPLARHNFGIGTSHPIAWSPSGRYLLHTFLGAGGAQTRVLGGPEVREITPPATNASFPYGWTPDDRIIYFSHENSSQSRPLSLWTIDATGGDPQKHLAGNFVPIGPNDTGTAFYALTPADGPDPNAPLTQLIEIDMDSGSVNPIASADQLAADLLGIPFGTARYRFNFATLSPDGTHFALGLARSAELGTPVPRAGANVEHIVFMRTSGRITGAVQVAAIDGYGTAAWSPDGSRLARFTYINRATDGQLQIFDTVGNQTTFTIERPPATNPPHIAWSPDADRLIYSTSRGLMLIAFDPHRNQLIVPGGTAPAWQPR
jgi:hypothetical protein